MAMKMSFFLLLLLALAAATASASQEAQVHKVGGDSGWREGVDYNAWSSNEKFITGDWLSFEYDVNEYQVLYVSEASYDNCDDQHIHMNATGDGSDLFRLELPEPYYFMSSKEDCLQGMRMVVNVTSDGNKHTIMSFVYMCFVWFAPVFLIMP